MAEEVHLDSKKASYWLDLGEGETGVYKASIVEFLLSNELNHKVIDILDIGCGQSRFSRAIAERLGAKRLVLLDYDPKSATTDTELISSTKVERRYGDASDVERWDDEFDLILFLDVLHEVYSFGGRPSGDIYSAVDDRRGKAAVKRAIAAASARIRPGGALVITDNVLPVTRRRLRVRARTTVVAGLVREFLDNYTSRKIATEWLDNRTFEVGAREFSILLTQYNKLKKSDRERWATERWEVHQYFSAEDYEELLQRSNFNVTLVLGTPFGASKEWRNDFEIVVGAMPNKRITLMATKVGAGQR